MGLPLLSIVAFAVAILLSCFTPVNVGLISVAFAFVVGVGFGDMAPRDVSAGFPSSLFLILVGVTLFFSQANANGTLDRIAKGSVRLVRGNPGWIPVVFFALASVLAHIGAGNIAATAMLAPIAMRVAEQARISAFLMTVMVATGANCGALSPFAPTGIIANGLMERIGITGGGFSPLSRAADEERAIKGIPWGTILMVSGVTVLIAFLEKTGGMDLFTQILARVSTPSNVTGVIAFVTGLISVYSTSSGSALHGERAPDRRPKGALQQASPLGPLDERGRRPGLLSVLWRSRPRRLSDAER